MRYLSIFLLSVTLIGCAHGQLTLNFTFWYQNSITVQEGEALVLDVTVVDLNAQSTATENYAKSLQLQELTAQRDSGLITPEDFNEQAKELQPVTTTPTRLGSEPDPWYNQVVFELQTADGWQPISWETVLLDHPEAQPQVLVDEVSIAIAAFGIDPETTSDIPEGVHTLRAVFSGSSMESETVQLRVTEAQTPLSFDRKLRLGRYWWMRGENQTALDSANELLQQNATHIDALTLKGNALAGLGRLEDAAASFETAIDQYYEQFPDAYEPPDNLIDMLIEVTDPR